FIASTAACWNALRTSLASEFANPWRCTISTYATPLTGSIQACVPYAPPCPNVPGDSIPVTPCGSRTTHTAAPQPLPGVNPVFTSPDRMLDNSLIDSGLR